MKRLFTFFALLLVIAGNAWGGTYVLNNSNRSSAESGSETFSGFTITNTGSKSYGNVSNTEYIKYSSGADHTLSGIPAGEKIVSITFEGYSNKSDATADLTIGETTQTFPTKGSTAVSHTWEVTVNSGESLSFRPTNECCFIITITTTIDQRLWSYAGSGSVTHTINDEEKTNYTTGTLSFINAGAIAGGTVISDVPGITMTLGVSGEEWSVVEGNGSVNPDFKKDDSHTWNIGYVAVINTQPNSKSNPTTGCFYTFNPTVNGELTIHYYTVSGAAVYVEGTDVAYASNNGTRIQSLTFMVEAGKTYNLMSPSFDKLWLNNYAFRPTFTINGEEQTAFTANTSTASSAYPSLLTTNAGDVAFSADRETATITETGEITLNNYGTTWVRGKVTSGNNILAAFYELTSNVLKLESTAPANNSTITALDNDIVVLNFDQNIQKLGGCKVYLKVDANAETEMPTANINVNGKKLEISGITLETGSTYTLTVKQGSLASASDANLMNAEIKLIFTMSSDEPSITMTTPTTLTAVPLGQAFILTTDYVSNGSQVNIDNGKKYYAYFKAEGASGNGTIVEALVNGNNLVFKPASELLSNTNYTLTLPTTVTESSLSLNEFDNRVKMTDLEVYITKNKQWEFSTGALSGTQPQMVSSNPAEGDGISNTTYPTYAGGTISVTFDQAVELIDYTTISCFPVNGSEATASANNYMNNQLNLSEDEKTISFNYSEDGLKYDIYYQLVIPATSVRSAQGGRPNEKIVINFKMGKNSNASATAADFYPHSWDFNTSLIGKNTDSNELFDDLGTSTADKKANKWYNNSTSTYDIRNYGANDTFFDQGLPLNIKGKAIEEAAGLRISLTKNYSNARIQLKSDALNIVGNTHYMTIPDVPEGYLYIVAKVTSGAGNHLFNINSPNAKFTDGYSDENGKIATLTGQWVKYKIEVTEAGDVSFAMGDVSIKQIGVTDDHKKALSSYDNFFTDCQSKPMRYDLTNIFTDQSVTAYYVDKSTGYTSGASTITLTPLAVAAAEEGVILQATESSDDVPIFAADVNSSSEEHTTALKGVLVDTTISATDGYNRNYAFTNLAGKVDADGNESGFKTTTLGFYRAMSSSTLGAHKSYLQLPKTLVDSEAAGAKSCIFINLLSWDDVDATGINRLPADAVMEKEANVYYTLEGLRLNGKPSKSGLYIVNGKKVFINK